MLPRYSNGRVPARELILLDTGNGRHLSTLPSGMKWYLLRRNVKARTGVTLYISPGMNAYRDWDEQGVGRRNACAQGNCNAAAAQGYSSHGGSWANSRRTGGRWVDAMAFDIGNYWAVPWSVFREECERVGLEVGLITRDIAGIDEPWHIIDLNPYELPDERVRDGFVMQATPDGVWHLVKPAVAGGGAEPFEPVEDELSRAEVDELKEFIRTQGFELHEETRRYAAGVPGNGADFVCYRRSDTPTDGVKRTYALYENTRKELFRVPVHNPSHLAALGDVKEMRRDVLLQYREWPSDGVNARPGVFQESVKSEDTGNVFDLFVDNKGHGVRRWIIDADEIASREATGVRAVSRAYILQFGPINQDTP